MSVIPLAHNAWVDLSEERWLSRVRGLLAKAESTDFPDEAEALTAKAMELMAKYGIEEALLAASMPQRQLVADRLITIPPPYLGGKQSLLSVLASHLGCVAVSFGSKGSHGTQVRLFGYPGDGERVEYLFTSLLVQIYTGLARAPKPAWETVRAFRHSWITGFTAAVSVRLQEATRRAEAAAATVPGTGSSVALVLADRGNQVHRRVTEEYPNLRQRRVTAGRSSDGFAAGTKAGTLADLGTTRLTSSN